MSPTIRHSTALKLAIDYGPLLVFFLAYRHWAPTDPPHHPVAELFAVIWSTVAFIVATLVALGLSQWLLGRIEPMLWLTAALVVGFGALTVALHDPRFIQLKPTAIYLLFAAVLLGGVWSGRALLKFLLGPAFAGLDDAGWLILSRNWGWFFLFLAVLNEALRRRYNLDNGGFGTWLTLKLWLFMPLSVLFTFAHMPMLLRHGLGGETDGPPAPPAA